MSNYKFFWALLAVNLVFLIILSCRSKIFTGEYYGYRRPSSPLMTVSYYPTGYTDDQPVENFKDFMRAYRARHSHAPPENLDKWFEFAKNRHCSLEEITYDTIYKNLQLFREKHYECVKVGHCKEDDPVISKDMQDRAADIQFTETLSFNNGLASTTGSLAQTLAIMLRKAQHWMPNVTIHANTLDEPRVLRYKTTPREYKSVSLATGSSILRKKSNLDILDLVEDVCDHSTGIDFKNHGFFLSPTSVEFVDELLPIFSQSSVSACFADIIFPSAYFWQANINENWKVPLPEQESMFFRNDASWPYKYPRVHWRGSTTGGFSAVDNQYMDFHRQRMVTTASTLQIESVAVDIAFSQIIQSDDDSYKAQSEKFVLYDRVPYEEAAKNKYLVDIDGNTFSQRIYPFLHMTQSLIFKLALFEDWVTSQIIPFAHYVPVSMDLHDLQDKLEWARENEGDAHRIAIQGQRFAQNRLRKDDMTCYMARLVLEYHALTI
eukprot:Partr_v1_DN28567_c0_g2_i3_m72826 putative capsule-associated protein CAP1